MTEDQSDEYVAKLHDGIVTALDMMHGSPKAAEALFTPDVQNALVSLAKNDIVLKLDYRVLCEAFLAAE